MGSPEEVLLQGWGYGRTRTDPFPPRMLQRPPKAEMPSSFPPSLILHGSPTMDTALPPPRMLDCP